jgi:ABC-2 type transport system ATP-binding protein
VGLDPIQIREIRQLIRELASEHSVILSTHILPEVQAICDRVQIINQGELVWSDTVASLDNMQSDSLLLALDKPPAESELASITNVISVTGIDDHRFRIHHPAGHAPAKDIATRAVEKGWGLLELTPERHSLEEIFVRITSGDHLSTDTTSDTDKAEDDKGDLSS